MKKITMFAAAALCLAVAQFAVAQMPNYDAHQQMTRDQLHVAVQEICPVSGQKLGAHGEPVKVKIGEEQVFLCCKGCLQGKVDPKHWATIHANAAKAQAKCPVMNRALPEAPQWTIVEGQIVYICCPPCAKKIEADPKTHLQKVDALYAASLEAQQVSRRR